MTRHVEKADDDRAGIVVASLCFVHCVAGPALLAFGGLASWIAISEKYEWAFFARPTFWARPLYCLHICNRHRRLSCYVLFAAGNTVSAVRKRLNQGAWAPMIVAIGALPIITAHSLNLKYSKRCNCRHAADGHSHQEVSETE